MSKDYVVPSAVNFPVIAIGKGTFSVKQSPDELTTGWKSLIKSGWFDSLRVIDSNLDQFVSTRVDVISRKHRRIGFNLFLGPQLQLDLGLVASATTSLEEVKVELLRLIDVDAGSDSRDDKDELKAEIHDSETLSKLIDVLTQHGFSNG